MEVLLITKDALVRDQLKVGLQQFPSVKVTVGSGYRGINELRSHTFDCVFLGVELLDQESMGMLMHLRSFDQTTELVALVPGREPKALANEKARYQIHSLLRTPLDCKELFSFLGRFIERHSGRGDGSRRPTTGKLQQSRAK